MANPQCEDGYTKIANELLGAFARIRIPGEASQVFWAILRKTYGFQKKEDAISLTQFVLATGLSKSHICDALKRLKLMNLITENRKGITKTYSVFKDFSQWKPLPKKGIFPNSGKIIPENRKNHSRIQIPQKIKETYTSDSIEFGLSEKLLSLIRQRHSNFKQPDIQKWATHIDRMLRLDKRPVEEIEKVIQWCQADTFWQGNILSTAKLREKYDQLYLKMTSNGQSATKQRYY